MGAHRIVWEMMKGPIPPKMVVDHVNRNPWDNRLENLRLATGRQNRWNSALHKHNTSGHSNIYWRSDKSMWEVRFSIKKKLNRLGLFTAIEDAIATRDAHLREMRGEFYSG